MLELIKCKRNITILWGVSALLLYSIVFFQTLTDKHAGHINDVWGWLLQCTLPTLSLMIGMINFETYNPTGAHNIPVNKFTYYIALILSGVYLILIFMIVLFQPISGKLLWELGKNSNIYLAPIQGLVSGVIGLFFSKQVNR